MAVEDSQCRRYGGYGEAIYTLPGVNDGNAVIDDHITTLDGAVGDQREERVALLESDGPVDEVQLMVLSVNRTPSCKWEVIRQGSPAQAQQGRHRGQPRQPPGGAGCNVLVSGYAI